MLWARLSGQGLNSKKAPMTGALEEAVGSGQTEEKAVRRI